jgi:hypothetical protein
VLTNHFLVLVCLSVATVLDLQLHVNQLSPITFPLTLTIVSLPLGMNVIVTTLIAARIWYLSHRKACNMCSAQFPTRTGQATIDFVIESGMLYLVVQLILVILLAIPHPGQFIVGVIAVQIYVRIHYSWKAKIRCKPVVSQNLTGDRTDADSHPRSSWCFKYTERIDSELASIINLNVTPYIVDASAYQYTFVHGTWPLPSHREVCI